jgi:cysteinyl-tRNA synthetase
MSKSLGNSLTIRDALKMYNYEVIKYVMLSKHYGSDVDILDEDYTLAEKHLYYFYNTIAKMNEFISQYEGNAEGKKVQDDISNTIKEKFIEVMDDDFNTTAALANLHGIFKYVNNLMKTANKGNRTQVANTLAKILEEVKEAYGVLGLFEQNPEEFAKVLREKYIKKINLDTEYIESEIAKRAEAKKQKDFETADSIRVKLDEQGIILNDTINGTTWDIKALY